ncbi:hypothetical protein SLEP1_g27876 [Rubroshorea leprosula]|uniref:Reverse transcriptase n=1 Tax=Rubroshorea leprosula TaxID=152421 RepID=A0AAV5K151_9ROSI|nr:hypothetical protein SLEP1_g27876 [Rubroshorea leprosula]
MSDTANQIPNPQEADLLIRSVKRIKGDGNPPIAEEYQLYEAPPKQLSYRDMVSCLEPAAILCDSSNREEILDEDSDYEDDGSIPTILISKEEKRRIRMPWLNSIIIKAFGTEKAGYNFILPRIKAQWKPRGKMDCVDLGLDFFLIRFHEKEDLNRVLHGGPWFVGPHFLTIRKWEPSFDPAKATFTTTAIWVRLPRLPIEYYDVQILERIGNMLGTPLRLDAHTAHQSRGQYARICVQVDLDEPLVPFVRIGKHIQKVLYEGPAALCYSCGCVGHKEDNCPLKVPQPMVVSNEHNIEAQTSQASVDGNCNEPPENQGFGPWMLVERRKNKKKVNNNHLSHSASRLTGTRNGSRVPNSKGNVISDNAINAATVNSNGSNAAIQLSNSNSKAHNSSSSPLAQDGDVNNTPAHRNTGQTNQVTMGSIITSPSSNGPNISLQVHPKTIADKATVTDKISLSPFVARGKASSFKKSGSQPKISQNVRNHSLTKSTPSTGTLDHGSNHLHQAKSLVGCTANQQEQSSNPNREGVVTSPQQASGVDRGMDIGNDPELLVESHSYNERSRSHSFSSPTNGRDSSTSGTPVSRLMHPSEGCLVITGGDSEMGRLVRADSSQAIHVAGRTTLPLSIQDDRMHEDSASGGHEGGSAELYAPVPADCAALLLPRSQHDGSEQGRSAEVAPGCCQHNPGILVIMETKLAGERAKKAAEALRFPKKVIVDSDGFAGGIWLLWDDTKYTIDILNVGPQAIHASVQVKSHPSFSNFHWFLSIVYGRPQFEIRSLLWENLKQFSQSINGPWVVIGDFNDVTAQNEKFGGNPVPQYRIRAYTDCMNSCDLLDIGFIGPKFTWVNKRDNHQLIRERLDRAWANPAWKILFPEATLIHLPRVYSDHCPILLSLEQTFPCSNKKPFRLEKFWLEHESFKDLVASNWTSPNLSISDCSITFQNNVKLWSRVTFDNLHKKKKNLIARLGGIQQALQSKNSSFLIDLEKTLSKEYQDILKYEEDMWFMKSRIQWIQNGDRNTKFFHVSALKRRSYNRILGLKDDTGSWITDATAIEGIITSYFKSLYKTSLLKSSHDSYSSVQSAPFIDPSYWHGLIDLPSEFEIKHALFSMKPFKAPGPDGLHAAFFQKYWLILKEKICLEIRDIFNSGFIPESWSASLITLIPKNNKPDSVSHFRPIGLCNTSYKIVTKIIVFRLKNLIGDLISPMQSSFIPGRNGIDNVTLLRDFAFSFKKRKGRQGDMIIKLDLEKAYDRLEWSSIRETLIFFNFPPLLIKLIMSCVSSASFSCVINGSVTDSFKPSRGLRQGDPLSPYLFILCLEYLSLKLQHSTDVGIWRGSKLGKSGPYFSHIFFADDLILIGKATMSNSLFLKGLLDFFCTRSGQNINQEKSKILFSANVNPDIRLAICHTLGYMETPSLGKYLGFPITSKRIKKSDCNFIVDKVRSKLAGWKANMLSLAGRVTLATSVLSSIPNYYMQGMFFPASIHKELDTITRNFIWGSTSTKRKANLISWDRITQPRKAGGIGIRASSEVNQAAMAKLHWRMITEVQKPWAKAFISKYKIDPPYHNFSRSSSPICKDISKGKDIVEKGNSWVPRDGSKINFWQDKWILKESLCSVFYGPFKPHDLDITVKDLLFPDGKWNFDAVAYPLPQDIIQKIVAIAFQRHSAEQDSFRWNSSANGKFSMKSAYFMAKNIHWTQMEDWSWIWNICTIPKIKYFLWLVMHGRILTFDTLAQWGVVSDNRCPRCRNGPETLTHIFRECQYAALFWNSIIPQSISTYNQNLDFKSWIKVNVGVHNSPPSSSTWPTVFSYAVWSIWYSRNQLVHDNKHISIFDLKCSTLVRAQECIRLQPALTTSPPKTIVSVGWSPPSPGGLLRDHLGRWMVGFSRSIGWTTSIAAELWAIRDGLEIAAGRGISKIIVETDSKVAILLIESTDTTLHSLGTLISDCRLLLRLFTDARISHIYREANAAADFLAKLGSTSAIDFVVYEESPPGLSSILYHDLIGTSFPRTIVAS